MVQGSDIFESFINQYNYYECVAIRIFHDICICYDIKYLIEIPQQILSFNHLFVLIN